MFYEYKLSKPRPDSARVVSAIVALTPSESKRLIGRAVASMPEVQRAMRTGYIAIARGTTNAFVVEELLGQKLASKVDYTVGCIVNGELNANSSPSRVRPITLKDGKPMNVAPEQAYKDFGRDDILIKGANAIDLQGYAGILVGGGTGGTIGGAFNIVVPRACHTIVPCGLEKLVPSVLEAARHCGILNYKYSTGMPVGLVPLITAQVVTEIQALKIIANVDAVHVASGGIGGSEGSVVLTVDGTEDEIECALTQLKLIKGEPNVGKPAVYTIPPAASLDYEAAAMAFDRHGQLSK